MSDSAPPGRDKQAASPGLALEWVKVALIPIVAVVIGYFFTSWQKESESIETNVRLYTQLISQREQSDSQLRTEMFKAVIEKFLSGGKADDLRDMVLKLELLTYNFHESLDLGPLFKEMLRKLEMPSSLSAEDRTSLRTRLDAAAEKVAVQQIAALSLNGERWSATISPEDLRVPQDEKEPGGVRYLIDERLSSVVDDRASKTEARVQKRSPSNGVPTRTKAAAEAGMRLRVEVLNMDLRRREVNVRLLVQSQGSKRAVVDRHFNVSLYDFPMLDNTRLPNGQRCSVVVSEFFVDEKGSDEDRRLNSFANLEVVIFPATSASLKERIEFNELLRLMLRDKSLQDG